MFTGSLSPSISTPLSIFLVGVGVVVGVSPISFASVWDFQEISFDGQFYYLHFYIPSCSRSPLILSCTAGVSLSWSISVSLTISIDLVSLDPPKSDLLSRGGGSWGIHPSLEYLSGFSAAVGHVEYLLSLIHI